MNTSSATRPHVDATTLDWFIVRSAYRTQAEAAMAAQTTPQNLGDLLSGRRLGSNPDLRARIADALGVPVESITCHCTRPDGACLSALDQESAA